MPIIGVNQQTPIAYFSRPENRGLGVVKTLRNHPKSLI
jgi:hypothetical protein